MRLENKVAIITGGASGIGKATAIGMLKEGAKVVIADVNEEKAKNVVEETENQIVFIKTDVSKRDQVEAMVKKTVETFGTVDILVCSAAVMPSIPMLETTVQQWDEILATNVKGVMLCCQYAGKVMADKKYGKIVIINSLAAYRGRGEQVAYIASKGSLITFVRSAGRQLGEYNVNVNAIAPGFMESENLEPLKNREERLSLIPMKRPGKPEDMVGPIIFFSTDDSAYVNAQTLIVDGAASIYLTGADQ